MMITYNNLENSFCVCFVFVGLFIFYNWTINYQGVDGTNNRYPVMKMAPKSIEKNKKVTKISSNPNSNAIIIPYRQRFDHLQKLIPHLFNFLNNKSTHPDLNFKIFVIEQSEKMIFNRAMLLNIGYLLAKKEESEFNCFTFHDVDMLPIESSYSSSSSCNYNCPLSNKIAYHLAEKKSNLNFTKEYEHYFGGISILTDFQMMKIGGNPNRFFGWGGEDDVLRIRLTNRGFTIKNQENCKINVLEHSRDAGNNLQWIEKIEKTKNND